MTTAIQTLRREGVVLLAITALLAIILYPAIEQSRNPNGPHGAMIPREPPEEKRRIRHPSGLSIIAPPNWEQAHNPGAEVPSLCLAARGRPGARIQAQIMIQPIQPPTETELRNLEPVVFQGFRGYELTQIQRESTLDDPAFSVYTLYVDDDSRWWKITFQTATRINALPPEIQRYLATITLPQHDDQAAVPRETAPLRQTP